MVPKGMAQPIDAPAIDRAIEAANTSKGRMVRFPAGTYACYSILPESKTAWDAN